MYFGCSNCIRWSLRITFVKNTISVHNSVNYSFHEEWPEFRIPSNYSYLKNNVKTVQVSERGIWSGKSFCFSSIVGVMVNVIYNDCFILPESDNNIFFLFGFKKFSIVFFNVLILKIKKNNKKSFQFRELTF